MQERMPAFKSNPFPCRLPVEALNDIMSKLDRPALARAASASQVLNVAATPRLYKSIALSTLATLLARPDLRSFGKDLAIPYDDVADSDDGKDSDGERHGASLIHLPTPSQQQIQSLGLNESLVQALEQGTKWAQAVLLLYLLPSLESLRMADWWPGKCREFFEAAVPLFGEPIPLAPGLRSLRSLVCSYGDTEGGFDAETVLRMLVLPSLNYLAVDAVNAEEWDDERLTSLHGLSSVTTLAFSGSAIDPHTLGHFVRIPRALESLEYSHGGATVGHAEIGVGELASALLPIREHLRELVVDDNSGELEDGAFGSLREFKNLVKSRTKVAPNLLTDEPTDELADEQ
jgi:hypothetical protein